MLIKILLSRLKYFSRFTSVGWRGEEATAAAAAASLEATSCGSQ